MPQTWPDLVCFLSFAFTERHSVALVAQNTLPVWQSSNDVAQQTGPSSIVDFARRFLESLGKTGGGIVDGLGVQICFFAG